MLKDIKEVKCKRCGGNNFGLSVFYQNIRTYKVLPNGKFSKRCVLEKDLPMEISNLICCDCHEIIDYWGEDENGIVQVDI